MRRRLAAREHALALGAGADMRHLDAELALDELDVAAGRGGQLGEPGRVVERLAPAGQRLVDRLGVVEVALVRREVGGLAFRRGSR